VDSKFIKPVEMFLRVLTIFMRAALEMLVAPTRATSMTLTIISDEILDPAIAQAGNLIRQLENRSTEEATVVNAT